jgi:molybdopterin synthase catalytic subunit
MIRVQETPFEPGAELAGFIAAAGPSVGGIASFIGLVRGEAGRVSAMTLEHYPAMTEKVLAAIAAEAESRWPIDRLLVIHRVGRLEPGAPIVLVATASAHRAAAFESCAFLVDWLKTKAPFWKLEEGPDGAEWVEAKVADDAAAARWNEGLDSA